jgi:hypothetical protein
MRLIGFAVILIFSLPLAPLAGEPQQTERVPRLCFLTLDSGTP